ncbi:PQQ-dependent sugar dehydrogenase [Halopelagius longus]|uniref:Copper binding protein, plastocyanin/azurin family n=1 Tax=Halopelagius longus TaxID=1236180 RepID=A0A1H1GSL8_9EURY|nr:PQQ-dependent sugar dehydrogenase [Halopelagius longus]SDR15836.1 Copper binding protein, plastocyanin/azurin family [Halopelagius longus]
MKDNTTDESSDHRLPLENPSRRTFLKSTVVAGGLASLGDVAAAENHQFELHGQVEGWIGAAPPSIEGVTNPTLEVKAGETYTITWVNVDGKTHNLVIVDDEGYQVLRTKLEPEQGAVQTVQFEATENMGEYYCEIHPRSMRGQFDNVGGNGETEADAGEDERKIPTGATIELEQVAGGLTHPLGLEYAPEEDDRLFVLDQTGQIYVLDEDGLRDEPFLTVDDKLFAEDLGAPELGGYDERGLLGLAFHPDFEQNRRFFVRYSAPVLEGTPHEYDHTEVLSEFRATEDLSRGDPDSERIIMTFPSPQLNHNAGQIGFGPDDGYLYVPMGDGGGAGDTGLGHVSDWYDENEGGNGQDVVQNLLGGIHRIDVDNEDGDRAYAIPDDNPLIDQEGRDEYYAWGLRNPWRMTFNDGDLFVGDLGQNLFEEVDIVEKGGNYGWNVKEGTHCFSTGHPVEPADECPSSTPEDVRGGEPLLNPIIEYRHRKTTTAVIDGNSVIGGYVYGTLPGGTTEVGDSTAPLDGKYVFGNWSNRGFSEPAGDVFAATEPENDDEMWSIEELQIAGRENGELGEFVMSFGRDHEGNLYVLTTEKAAVTGNTGKVYKIVGVTEEETEDTGTETETQTETETAMSEAENESTTTTETDGYSI